MDKCERVALKNCRKIIEQIKNTSLMIEDVDELEILKIEEVAKKVKEVYTKVVIFPKFLKEVYCD